MESCCTCATVLSTAPPYADEKSEKPLPEDRRVGCCSRIICGKCIHRNRRFAEYCPYCQISNTPSSLPQRLKEPPIYTSVPSTSSKTTELADTPPPYTAPAINRARKVDDEKAALADEEKESAEDTLHFLNHEHDSISSLSLRYGVPASALRSTNNITSDHLLLGRRTILIPGKYYKGGVSLSPRPIEGEDEELRKSKIRRFMTSCKVSDYDVALLYLEQSSYDLGDATQAYADDEAWERDHPRETGGEKMRSGKGNRSRGLFWRGL